MIENNYTLPRATKNVLGGVMIGDGISIDSNGKISIDFSTLDQSDIERIITDMFSSNQNLRANKNRFGIVKIGSGIDIDSNGTISVNTIQGQ
jgi:hypothetical protein